MISYLEKFKPIIITSYLIVASLVAQDLEDLSFGDDNSLDIATWNIEWFPKNNQITIDYVTEIVNLLDLDILAIQELDDTAMFDQMLDSLPAYLGYYESIDLADINFDLSVDIFALLLLSDFLQ